MRKTLWLVMLAVALVVPSANAASGARGYDLRLKIIASADAPLRFDDPGASVGYTLAGKLHEFWIAQAVVPNALDAQKRLRHPISVTTPFGAEQHAGASFAVGGVSGDWHGEDYRFGGIDRYPYTCRYSAEASEFKGNSVTWNLHRTAGGHLFFNVFAGGSTDDTPVHCTGGDPGRGFDTDLPGPPGWPVGALEKDEGFSFEVTLKPFGGGVATTSVVDLAEKCGGPCGGPELTTAGSELVVGVWATRSKR